MPKVVNTNMAKAKSRPQMTVLYIYTQSAMKIVDGKKIRWELNPVWVRVPPAILYTLVIMVVNYHKS